MQSVSVIFYWDKKLKKSLHILKFDRNLMVTFNSFIGLAMSPHSILDPTYRHK